MKVFLTSLDKLTILVECLIYSMEEQGVLIREFQKGIALGRLNLVKLEVAFS